MSQNLSSAGVVIGALRVKSDLHKLGCVAQADLSLRWVKMPTFFNDPHNYTESIYLKNKAETTQGRYNPTTLFCGCTNVL